MARTPAKKQAAKPAPKRKAAANTAAAPASGAGPDRREESMSIRKISNGYVVRETWVEGSGPKAKYQERETFTKTKPVIKL